MTATEQLKKEHQAIRLALIFLDAVRSKIEKEEVVDIEKLEKLSEFFNLFVDRCHHGKEENMLFPELEKVGIPKEQGPIGVMLTEHEIGRNYLRILRESIESYKTNPNSSTAEKIAQSIKGYIDLLEQHIYKENNVLFMMAEVHFSEKVQRELFEKFEELEINEIGAGKHEEFHKMLKEMKKDLFNDAEILDVREIPPAQRHRFILDEFDKLNLSKSFILVNDHDPKPLYYQFQEEKPGRFGWAYISDGPTIWSVKITKTG